MITGPNSVHCCVLTLGDQNLMESVFYHVSYVHMAIGRKISILIVRLYVILTGLNEDILFNWNEWRMIIICDGSCVILFWFM